MKRVFGFGVLVALFLLILAGCSQPITGDEKTAADYVKASGYKISSYKGQIHKYILVKSKLYGSIESLQYRQMWGVQRNEPDPYFGKEITIYRFVVSDHPLEELYKTSTSVYVMLSEGKAIGGYSFPNKNMVGAVYSMDGRTVEEVTGLTYQEWAAQWQRKYE
ncbi:hypothetical protein [Paenibacillus koleovorans]|uniref:hypothetical protein n=1 Tax=Paenibacillus koleovorans TaxID=121608 RepID=UPI000FDC16E6|nr:hypothetical protein [Paenibacillus koleovorans]